MEAIDFVVSLILTIVLIVCFSYFRCCPMERQNGPGVQQKGDSGLILPGEGEEMAEVNFVTDNKAGDKKEPTADKNEVVVSKTENTTKAKSEETTQEIKEEQKKVEGLVLSFWHGVAAVLIGETVALMVACAWMKIRGGK